MPPPDGSRATDLAPPGATDVVGVGYTTVDHLAVAPLPERDTKLELPGIPREGGGPTATAMATVARLGARARFIGIMGDDERGSFMRRSLEEAGVDARFARVVPGADSQFSFVIVDPASGERTILWTRNGLPPLAASDLDPAWVTAGRVLHLDTHELAVAPRAAAWARDAGMAVVLDAGTPRAGIGETIALVRYCLCAERFPAAMTGRADLVAASREILALGPEVVITTLGARGALTVTRDEVFESPGYRVDVRDTTGAGDVFHGAFDFGLLQSWPLRELVDFANAAAALKCRSAGGRAGIPALEEVQALRRARSG